MSSTAASAAPISHPLRSSAAEWSLIAASGAFKLWLVNAWSLGAIGWAGHDDHWFLNIARSILDGRWLGEYDELTLIKGVGYPFFIALVSRLGLPLLLAEQILYVLACVAVYRAFAPRIDRSTARLVLYGALLFNPMSYTSDVAGRVTREGIYPALTLLALAGIAGVLFRLGTRARTTIGWALLAGVSLAWLWHTREEGVWIVPLAVAAVVAVVWWVVRGDRMARLRIAIPIVAVPLVVFVGAWLAIVITNGVKYGVYTTVEMKDPSFLRAYGALVSVRQHPTITRVPVTREVREKVYAVSPAFAELRPYLDGEVGRSWMRASDPYVDGEIGGGWFVWAFRESVARAGYYARGAEAVDAYYERIAREIETARMEGLIDARPARASMLPALMAGERVKVAGTWLRGWLQLATFQGFSSQAEQSSGLDWDILSMADEARARPAARDDGAPIMRLRVRGSAVSNAPVTIDLQQGDGSAVPWSNVAQKGAVREGSHWRTPFDLVTPIGRSDLVVLRGGREVARQHLTWELTSSLPALGLTFDQIRVETLEVDPPPAAGFRFGTMQVIAYAYHWAFALILLAAIALYARGFSSALREEDGRRVLVLLVGVFASIATRLLILALIEVTSFPAMVAPYLTAAHALMIVAMFLMAHDGLTAMRLRRASR